MGGGWYADVCYSGVKTKNCFFVVEKVVMRSHGLHGGGKRAPTLSLPAKLAHFRLSLHFVR